jgi:hypothetical protein
MNQTKPKHSDHDIRFRPARASQWRDQVKIDEIVEDVSLSFQVALSEIVKSKPPTD